MVIRATSPLGNNIVDALDVQLVDALIAAVREEQKAKCEARVLALNWVAEPDLNDIVEAIRNA